MNINPSHPPEIHSIRRILVNHPEIRLIRRILVIIQKSIPFAES